jgi:hypothetical protein
MTESLAQPISTNGHQPNLDRTALPINAAQLCDIAELLNILDGFLRHGDDIANRLTDYLHATGYDRPQPPDGTSYNANLLIDQLSFTAHNLRAHRRKPLQ